MTKGEPEDVMGGGREAPGREGLNLWDPPKHFRPSHPSLPMVNRPTGRLTRRKIEPFMRVFREGEKD
jgi:hypothetical protein